MGAKCCTDRKEPVASTVTETPSSKAPGRDRKSVYAGQNYDTKKRAISVAYQSNDDAEKFDKAFVSHDLKAFVELLPSEQPIVPFQERMHPWAADPKTVGSLSGAQLAILASNSEKSNPRVKDDMREAGAIEGLVELLKSNEQDRSETGAVALHFLTTECPENSTAAHKAGAMPPLLKHLESPVPGMRGAAATILRNICMESEEYRKEFVQMGDLKDLVNQLVSNPDPSMVLADVQLEALLNLQDMLQGQDGTVIEEYAKLAIQAGAIDKLKRLCQAEDDEVRGIAAEIMADLAKIEKK
eukprot:TRINITY_DN958_c0_g2_i2.p1 TRINITY_DN958_c0_g2~~TRINITY_DN958_c0_g2_i2.p1  ORF type:complete len:299 (-),score=54.95 TRINITY_DN958_c0_g2_i2:233-1129(-)